MIALLVITDGRTDCITRTVASASEQLEGHITERWMYDDSGDLEHRVWLMHRFPQWQVFYHPDGRQGFGGAIRAAWERLREESTAEYIFHLEDDFTFNRPVPLDDMIEILDEEPRLAQVALRRQAWNSAEKAAGGVIETNPDAYTQRSGHDVSYLEHDLFFTTNPSLYSRRLIEQHDWPISQQSEGVFTATLRAASRTFAYLGERTEPPWVHHIGDQRTGTGY